MKIDITLVESSEGLWMATAVEPFEVVGFGENPRDALDCAARCIQSQLRVLKTKAQSVEQ